jgi:hypothetical protein
MVRELDQRSVDGLTVTLAEKAAEAFAHPFMYVDADGLAEAEVQTSVEVASS